MKGDPWTPAEDATLCTLYAEGKSYSEIGAAIGRTKCAAISRSKKLKLPSRGAAHFARMSALTARKQWDKWRESGFKRANPRERKPPMFLRVVSVPNAVPVDLEHRTGCCYPVTEKGPHLFCNEPVEAGDYCGVHFRLMYPRKRAA